jgi:Flp pilus assembly protein TadB
LPCFEEHSEAEKREMQLNREFWTGREGTGKSADSGQIKQLGSISDDHGNALQRTHYLFTLALMWWLLLLLLVPLVWLLQLIVGALTPASSSGRFYLRTLLKKAGVLPFIPDGCVRELVDHDLHVAQAMSQLSHESTKTEMVKMLDGTATIITVWVRGERLPIKEDGPIPRTLAKYGVQRGVIK